MCNILGQNALHRKVSEILYCNYHFQTAWHAQHFEIDFCKLDATLRLAEARSCKWNGICNMLELSSAHCTYCMVFVARSAKIGKLHSAYNIVKPTFVNCAELAAV
jgi:hypothetical protein